MLRPGTEFPIGYGDIEAIPRVFHLPENFNVDVTVFKLFVTSKPTDFSFLPQESPFDSDEARVRATRSVALQPDVWGTAVVTVVQKRASSS